jgi:ribosomal protein S18 acetylase RimI-like enzyme
VTAAVELAGEASIDALASELSAIWATVFSAPPYSEPPDAVADFEVGRLRRHAARDGFAIAIAREPGGAAIGFGYGMTGVAESWWSAYLRERVDPAIVDAWVPDAFELTELAVLPEARGTGLGRALLTALLTARPESRVVCQTIDEETPARQLYRSLGFAELARFDRSVLLGRELPLP